ncbi:HPP family-domain-containing protein [Haematococcus lacustris]
MHVMHPSSSMVTTTSSVFPTLPLLRYRVPVNPRQLSEWSQPGYCRLVQHALTRHSAGELATLATTVGGDAATEPSQASCLASSAASTAPMREAQADNQSSPISWDHGLNAWCQHAYSRTPAQLLADRAHIVQSKRASASDVVWSSLGMFCAVYALGTANSIVSALPGVGPWHQQGLGLLLGSFGTICVLLFGRPEAEAIRTWNLVVGHLTSVSVVLCVLGCLGSTVFSRALAMALALASMLLTDSVHPPGGALVLMAMDSRAIQSMQAWFLVYPSLAWTLALLLPLGAATNWLKRNVQFQWPSHSSLAPTSDDVAPLPIQAASHAELRLKVA